MPEFGLSQFCLLNESKQSGCDGPGIPTACSWNVCSRLGLSITLGSYWSWRRWGWANEICNWHRDPSSGLVNCIFNEMDDHFEFLYCFYVVMCSFSVKYELCYLGLLVICCSSNFNNVVGCGFQTHQLKFFHFDNSINFLNFSSKLNVIEISWHICMYGILH